MQPFSIRRKSLYWNWVAIRAEEAAEGRMLWFLYYQATRFSGCAAPRSGGRSWALRALTVQD
jgi:hypothetical protein